VPAWNGTWADADIPFTDAAPTSREMKKRSERGRVMLVGRIGSWPPLGKARPDS
jgi:hypothetical protein